MKKVFPFVLLVIASPVAAEDLGIKPGLWEVHPISQVVDGRDVIADMAAQREKMQKSLANLPPEQRKKMEAALNGISQVCITPAMAAKAMPMMEAQGSCPPTNMKRNGASTSFEFQCANNGRTTVGKGERTINGDNMHTRVEMTSTTGQKTVNMKSESEMVYLGQDCAAK